MIKKAEEQTKNQKPGTDNKRGERRQMEEDGGKT